MEQRDNVLDFLDWIQKELAIDPEDELYIKPAYVKLVDEVPYFKIYYKSYIRDARETNIRETYPNIEEGEGDILGCQDSWAVACTTAEDLTLCRGVAQQFEEVYECSNIIRRQKRKVGQVAVFRHSEEPGHGQGQYVFFLIIKRKFFEKPEYIHVYAALARLRTLCVSLGVIQIAMPKIATGTDELDFKKVRHLIAMAFENSAIMIRIYDKPRRRTPRVHAGTSTESELDCFDNPTTVKMFLNELEIITNPQLHNLEEPIKDNDDDRDVYDLFDSFEALIADD